MLFRDVGRRRQGVAVSLAEKPPALVGGVFPRVPPQLRHLPLNSRGYPVPWFAVHPERVTVLDPAKRRRAITERLCWICGRPLGHRLLCFVLGPAQAVTRVVQEPPSHPGCAWFAAKTCPFMLTADYRPSDIDPAEHRLHNPGCFVVWRTDAYAVDGEGRVLIGPPETVTWFHQGRAATRTEVLDALEVYRPHLDVAHIEQLMPWLPRW